MSKPIFVPGILSSPTGLKDGSFKFTIYCNELPPEKIGQIFTLNNKYVYIALKEEDFLNKEKLEIELLESNDLIGKTPSQRLRNVLYIAFVDTPQGFDSFDQYYRFRLEKIIEHFKSKLPEL